MVAAISGSGLGLYNTSATNLNGQGAAGTAPEGKTGEEVYVNTATGNLVLQDSDELLAAEGLDVSVVRTYNSQGQFNGGVGQNWRLGVDESLSGLTGTVNTAGSTITKTFGDGATVTYTYNASLGLYTSSAGPSADDTLSFNATTQQWTWTDSTSRTIEVYSTAGQLLSSGDSSGNTVTYGYTGSLLTQITDASGQVTTFTYSGGNITQIATKSNGVTQTLVYYSYDSQGRLSQVTIDLSPQDNSISDGNTYVTTYTYQGTTDLVSSITQSDGTKISFTYAEVDGEYRVASYTDGLGNTSTITYSQNVWDWQSASFIETSSTAASSPEVAFNSQGNGLAVFVEGNDLMALAYNGATHTWASTPTVVVASAYPIDTPSLAMDPNTGNAVLGWVQSNGTVNTAYAIRYNGTTGKWDTSPTQLESSSLAVAANQEVVTAINGTNAVVGWLQLDSTSTDYLLNVAQWNGSSWSSPQQLGTLNNGHGTYAPSIALDSAGDITALWAQSNGTTTSAYVDRYTAGGSWSGPTVLAQGTASAPTSHPLLGFDSNGNAQAIWQQGNELLASSYKKSTNTWSTAVVLYNAGSGTVNFSAPSLSVAANGDAVAAWMEGTNSTGYTRYVALFGAATGSWTAPQSLGSFVGLPAGNTVVTAINSGSSPETAGAGWVGFNSAGQAQLYVSLWDAGTGTWSAPTFVQAAGNTNGASQPSLAISATGQASIVWREWWDANTAIYVNSASYVAGDSVTAGANSNALQDTSDQSALTSGIQSTTTTYNLNTGDTSTSQTGAATYNLNSSATSTTETTSTTTNYSLNNSSVTTPTVGWQAPSQLQTIADAASNPLVAADSSGNNVILTTSGGNLFAQRYIQASNTVTGPVLLNALMSTVYAPSLAVDASGNALAAWVQSNGTTETVYVARYSASAGSWSAPVALESSSNPAQTGAGSVATAIDGQYAVVTWIQSDGTTNRLYAARYNGSVWSTASTIDAGNGNPAAQPTVAIDASGNVMALWQQSNGTASCIYANHFAASSGTWGGASLLESSTTAAASPTVRFDGSGNGFAVWSEGGAVYEAHYSIGTGSWSTPANLATNTNAVYAPSLSVDTSGDALVAWIQSNGTNPIVYAAIYSASAGTWSAASAIESAQVALPAAGGALVTSIAGSYAVVNWLQVNGSSNWLYQATYSSGAWTAPTEVDTYTPAAQPGVAIDAQGHVSNVYTVTSGPESWAYRNGATLLTPAAVVNNPQIGMPASGSFMTMWSSGPQIWVQPYTPAKGTLGSPTSLNYTSQPTYSPSLAVDGAGNALAAWIQVNGSNVPELYLDRYSAATSAWTGTYALGSASEPAATVAGSVATAIDGQYAAAVWIQSDGTTNRLYVSVYNGSNWSTAAAINAANSSPSAQPNVAVDASGNVMVVWQQSNGTANSIYANHYSASSSAWSGATLLESSSTAAANPHLDFDGSGNGFALWSQGGALYEAHYSVSSGSWSTAVDLAANSNSVSAPDLAVDSAGNAIAAWIQSNGTTPVVYVSSYSASSGTWSAATAIESSSAALATGSGNVAVAINGSYAAVGWIQANGSVNSLYTATLNGTTWGGPTLMGTSNGASASEPALAIDSAGNVSVVWQQSTAAVGFLGYQRYNNDPRPYYSVNWGDTWSTIAQKLYGSTAPASDLQTQMGNPTLSYGLLLKGMPATESVVTTTTTTVAPYYTVVSGDTWSSIAQKLYGTTAAASQLQTQLGNPALTVGAQLTNLPSSETVTTTTTVPPYYTVVSGDTWSSIAQKLYGTTAAASQLQIQLGNPALTVGAQLTNLPGTEAVTTTTGTSAALYYTVKSGDTWSSITQALYGTSDPKAASALQSALNNPALSTGGRLTGFPSTLSYSDTTTGTAPSTYMVQPGGTWSSIAQALYGTSDPNAVAALQSALGDPVLDAEVPLTGLPSSLTYAQNRALLAPAYYIVQPNDTWATIVLAVYGTSDPSAAAALQSALASPTLTAGTQLTVPLTLTYTPSVAGSYATQTEITDQLGNTTTLINDSSGRLVEIESPAVNGASPETQFTYGVDGKLDQVTQYVAGTARSTVYQYDSNGNLLLSRNADGDTTTWTYDAADQVLTQTAYSVADPNGSSPLAGGMTTWYVYDSDERLCYTISPTGDVTEYTYDSHGNRTSQIVFDGAQYNVSGLSTSNCPTLAQMTSWASAQNLTQTERTDYTYDFRGNLSTKTVYTATSSTGAGAGTASTTQYVYDQYGRLLQEIDPRGSTDVPNASNSNLPYATTYTYDGLGRVLTETQWVSSGNTVTTSNTYTASTNTVATTFANGLVTTKVYDADGNLLSVTNSGPGSQPLGTTTYQYDADGRLAITTDPTGVRQYFVYDADGRKVGEVDVSGDGNGTASLAQYVYDSANDPIETIHYADYLSAATVATLTTSSGQPAAVSIATLVAALPTTVGRAYDQVSRSVYDAAGEKIYDIDASGDVTQYVHDGAGRLTSQIQYANPVAIASSVTVLTPSQVQVTSSATQDRKTSYFYDNNGQLVGQLDARGYLTQNTYDDAGQLIQTLAYATASPSVSYSNGTWSNLPAAAAGQDELSAYFYDQEGRQVGEFQAAGTAVNGGTNGTGYFTQTQYDPNNNVNKVTQYAQALSYTPGTSTDATLLAAAQAAAGQTGATPPRVTSYVYDGLNRLIQETNYQGTVTDYTYDAAGNLTSTTVGVGSTNLSDPPRTTQTQYNALGQVTAQLSAVGSAQLATDTTQAEINQTWADYGTSYQYDAAGRRISQTVTAFDAATGTSQIETTFYFYNDAGQLRFTVNGDGDVTENQYNALGELAAQVSYFDAVSNPSALVGGVLTSGALAILTGIANSTKDKKTSYGYTLTGKVASTTTAAGGSVTSSYDAFGEVQTNVTVVSAGIDFIQNFSYDLDGDLYTKQSDPTGADQLLTYGYDAFGHQISATDQYTNRTSTEYDALGRIVATVDAVTNAANAKNGTSATTTLTTYDGFSQVLTRTDASSLGDTTTYSYNDSAHSETVTSPDKDSVTTTVYNNEGQVSTITTGTNTTTYTYDLNGDVTGISDDMGTLSTRTYDSAGNVLTSTDGNGTATAYTYDQANQVLTETVDPITAPNPDGLALKTSYVYDGEGQVTSTTDDHGIVTATTYDNGGHVIEVIVDPGSGTNPLTNQPYLNLTTTYLYDNEGDVVQETQGVNSGNPRVTQYTYDAMGLQTEQVIDPGTGTNPLTNLPYLNLTTQYFYDANGNLVHELQLNTPPNGAPLNRSTWYVYDADDRLHYTVNSLGDITETDYDADGRVSATIAYATPMAVPAQSVNQLSSLTPVTSSADRVQQTFYNGDGQQEYSIDAAGTVTQSTYDSAGNVIQLRVIGGTKLNARYASTAAVTAILGNTATTLGAQDRVQWTAYDARNRAIVTIDATGAVTETQYDGDGNVASSTAYATLVTPPSSFVTSLSASIPQGGGVPTITVNGGSAFTVTASSAADRTTRYWYDTDGRQVFELSAAGYLTQTQYNDTARTKTVTVYAAKPTIPAGVTTSNLEAAAAGLVTGADGSVITRSAGTTLPTGQVVAADQTTTTYFDADGRVSQVTDALGHSEYYSYDALGNKISYTNQLAQTWTYKYDTAGRLIEEDSPQVSVTSITGSGSLSNTTTTASIVTQMTYDAFGNVVNLIEGLERTSSGLISTSARTTTYGYDALGRQISVTLPSVPIYNGVSSTEVDESGSYITSNSSPQTPTTQVIYDTLGDEIASRDADGNWTYKVYDQLGRVLYGIDALNGVTGYTYDQFGNQTTTTRYATALSGTINPSALTGLEVTSMNGGVTTITATNGAGSATFQVTANGGQDRTITTTYDQDNRVKQVSQPAVYAFVPSSNGEAGGQTFTAPPTTFYDYNAFGQVVRAATLVSAPNGASLVSTGISEPSASDPATDSSGNSWSYSYTYYDQAGSKSADINADGYLTTYQYDAEGNLTDEYQYAQAVSSASASGYTQPSATDTINNLVSSASGSTVTVAWTPDSGVTSSTFQVLIGSTWTSETVTSSENSYSASFTLPASGTYQYRITDLVSGVTEAQGAGNISFIAANGTNTAASAIAAATADRQTQYQYDQLNRQVAQILVGVQYTQMNGGAGSLSANAAESGNAITYYGYDAVGNQTSVTTNIPGAQSSGNLAFTSSSGSISPTNTGSALGGLTAVVGGSTATVSWADSTGASSASLSILIGGSWSTYTASLTSRGYWTVSFALPAAGTYQYQINEQAATYTYYDVLGRVIATAGPTSNRGDGNTVIPLTLMQRDVYGNLVAETQYAEGLTAWPPPGTAPTPTNNANTTATVNDRITYYLRDAQGHALETEQVVASGNVIEYDSYDADGNLVKQYQPADGSDTLVTFYVYDALGRQTQVIRPELLGSTTQVSDQYTEYNVFGEVIAQGTDPYSPGVNPDSPSLYSKLSSYDVDGRAYLTISSTGAYTAYLYDLAGNATGTLQDQWTASSSLSQINNPAEVGSIANASSSVSGSTVTVTWTADNTVTSGSLAILIGGSWSTYQATVSGGTASVSFALPASGTYQYQITDLAGGQTEAQGTGTISFTDASSSYGLSALSSQSSAESAYQAYLAGNSGLMFTQTRYDAMGNVLEQLLPTYNSPSAEEAIDSGEVQVQTVGSTTYLTWNAPADATLTPKLYIDGSSQPSAFSTVDASLGSEYGYQAQYALTSTNLANGTHTYKIVYTRTDGTVAGEATGTFNVTQSLTVNSSAPGAVSSVGAGFSGSNLVVSWVPDSTADTPAFYLLVGGTWESATITTSESSAIATLTAPAPGTYQYRITDTLNGLTEAQGTGTITIASAYTATTLNVQPGTTGTVRSIGASVSGQTATVSWIADGDVGSASLQLLIGGSWTSPYQAFLAEGAASVSFTAPAAGTYQYRIVDLADGMTEAESTGTISFATTLTNSSLGEGTVSNIASSVSGSTVTVSWTPDGGVTSSTFEVLIGSTWTSETVTSSENSYSASFTLPASGTYQYRIMDLLNGETEAGSTGTLTYTPPTSSISLSNSGGTTGKIDSVGASVNGSTVAVSWIPDSSSVTGTTFYLLIGSTWTPYTTTLSEGAASTSFALPAAGTYQYRITDLLSDGVTEAQGTGTISFTAATSNTSTTGSATPAAQWYTPSPVSASAAVGTQGSGYVVSSASPEQSPYYNEFGGIAGYTDYWSGTDAVELSWLSLASGTYTLNIYYNSASSSTLGISSTALGPKSFTIGGGSGGEFTWQDTQEEENAFPAGGISSISYFQITQNGSVVRDSRSSGVPTTTITWNAPSDTSFSGALFYRVSGTSTYTEAAAARSSGTFQSSLSELAPGTYDYIAETFQNTAESPTNLAEVTGQFVVTSNSAYIASQSGTPGYLSGVAVSGSSLTWAQAPESGATVQAQLTGPATYTLSPTTSNGTNYSASFAGYPSGTYTYTISYVSGGSTYLEGTGTIVINTTTTTTPATANIGTPTQLSAISGFTNLGNGVFGWTTAPNGTDGVVFSYDSSGTWKTLTVSAISSGGTTYQSVNLSSLPAGSYAYEVAYTASGAAQPYAEGFGTVTVGTTTTAGTVSLGTATPLSAITGFKDLGNGIFGWTTAPNSTDGKTFNYTVPATGASGTLPISTVSSNGTTYYTVNLASIPGNPANIDYEIDYTASGANEPYSVGRGTVGISTTTTLSTPTQLSAISGFKDLGNGMLGWTTAPGGTDGTVFDYTIPGGASGPLPISQVSVSGTTYYAVNLASIAGSPASIEYEVEYTASGASQPYAVGWGGVGITRTSEPESVSISTPSELSPISGFKDLGNGVFGWTTAHQSTDSPVFNYTASGGSGTLAISQVSVNGTTYYTVNLDNLPPGLDSIEYEVAYTASGATQPYAVGTGTVTVNRSFTPATDTTLSLAQQATTPVESQTLDRWGNVISSTNTAGDTTYYVYNRYNDVIQTIDPAVTAVSVNVASTGNVNGLSTSQLQDMGSYSSTTTIPISNNFYDLYGNLVGTRDADGNVNGQSYNAANQLIGQQDADGGGKSYVYDAFGDQIQVTTAVSAAVGSNVSYVTRNFYDEAGRLIDIDEELAAGALASSGKADSGFAGDVVQGNANVILTQYEYDQAGRRIESIDGMNYATKTAYDLHGNVISTTTPPNALGETETTYYRYNVLDQKVGETDPDGNTQSWSYDDFNNLLSHVDLGGNTYTYNYDPGSELLRSVTSTGPTGSLFAGENKIYVYDSANHLIEIDDKGINSITYYEYDTAGRVERQQTVDGGLLTEDTSTQYDAMGRASNISGLGYSVSYSYDAAGNRTNILADYTTAVGQLSTQDLWYGYDAMNRVVISQGENPTGTNTIGVNSTQGTILTYDWRGDRISATTDGPVITEVVTGSTTTYSAGTSIGYYTYTYDGAGRLIDTYVQPQGQGDATPVLIDSRVYDLTSRLRQDTTQTMAAGATAPTTTTQLNGYNPDGSLNDSETLNGGPTGQLESMVYYTGTVTNESGQTVETDYYDAAGNLLGYEAVLFDSNGDQAYDSYVTLSYVAGNSYLEGQETVKNQGVFDSSPPANGSTTYTYNADQQLIQYTDNTQSANNRDFLNNAQGQALVAVQGVNSSYQGGTAYGDNAAADTAFSNALMSGPAFFQSSANAQYFFYDSQGNSIGTYGELDGASGSKALTANFDTNFTPISQQYPAAEPPQYVAQDGDTLAIIAARIYGDSSLWYIIAQANGLTQPGPNDALTEGTALTIPNVVVDRANNAQTFKPFDVSEALGNTTPYQAPPPPPQASGGGCGTLGEILIAAVALVVAAYVGFEVYGALESTLGSTLAGVAGGAVGATAGSIASQTVGIAIGQQSSFNWSEVASAAIAGAVGGGLIGAEGNAVAGSVEGAIANAVVDSAVGQEANIAFGLQKSFNWEAVAAAAVAAPLAQAAGGRIGSAAKSLGTVGDEVASNLAQGAVNEGTYALFTGGKLNYAQIIADGFGNGIGDSMVQNLLEQEQDQKLHQQVQQLAETQLYGGYVDSNGNVVPSSSTQLGSGLNGENPASSNTGPNISPTAGDVSTASGSSSAAATEPLTNNQKPLSFNNAPALPEIVVSATRLPPNTNSLFDSIFSTSGRSTTSQAPPLLAYNGNNQSQTSSISGTESPPVRMYYANGSLQITNLPPGTTTPTADPSWVEAVSGSGKLYPIILPDGTIIHWAQLSQDADGNVTGGIMSVTTASDVAAQDTEIAAREQLIAGDQAAIAQLTADESSTPPMPEAPSLFSLGGKLGVSFGDRSYGVELGADLFPFNPKFQLNLGLPSDSYEFSLNQSGDIGATAYGLGGNSGGDVSFANINISNEGMVSATLPESTFNIDGLKGTASPELGANPIGLAMLLPNVTLVMQEGAEVGKLLTDQPQIDALREQVQALQSSLQTLKASPLPATIYNIASLPPGAS